MPCTMEQELQHPAWLGSCHNLLCIHDNKHHSMDSALKRVQSGPARYECMSWYSCCTFSTTPAPATTWQFHAKGGSTSTTPAPSSALSAQLVTLRLPHAPGALLGEGQSCWIEQLLDQWPGNRGHGLRAVSAHLLWAGARQGRVHTAASLGRQGRRRPSSHTGSANRKHA